MRLEQGKANLASVEAFSQQVSERKKVSQGLAHFLAFDEQMRAMQPIFDKFLSRGLQSCSLALSDFIFVMGEHQIFAAQVEIKTWAEKFHAHGAAFDMP